MKPLPVILPLVLSALLCSPLPGATLLVANKSDDTVDLVDLDSGESVATLPTGHAPHEIAVSADGKTAVVSNYGDRAEAGSSLTVIDVASGRVLDTVDLGRHTRPHGLAWVSASEVAVTAEGSKHLLVVDPFVGRVLREIDTGQDVSHMVAVEPGGGRAFVANIGSGTVTVADLAKGVKLGDVATGPGAEGIASTPDGTEVWVANRAADTISVLDSQTLEVKATVPCPGFPIRVAMAPDGLRALVSAARSGEVVLLDVQARKELARSKLDLKNAADAATRLFGDRFGASPVPVGLVIHPGGKRAWVAATQADAVVAIDIRTLEAVGLIEAGREPDGMAYSPLDAAAGAAE